MATQTMRRHCAPATLTVRPAQPAPAPVVARQPDPCPRCGSPVHNWYSPNGSDPGDVDPRADCTNLSCDWGY